MQQAYSSTTVTYSIYNSFPIISHRLPARKYPSPPGYPGTIPQNQPPLSTVNCQLSTPLRPTINGQPTVIHHLPSFPCHSSSQPCLRRDTALDHKNCALLSEGFRQDASIDSLRLDSHTQVSRATPCPFGDTAGTIIYSSFPILRQRPQGKHSPPPL